MEGDLNDDNELQEKIAHLIDERNRLQEIIRELT